MSLQPSLQTRRVRSSTLRLNQPRAWADGFGLRNIAQIVSVGNTTNATVHTPSSWVQLVASTATSEETAAILLTPFNMAQANTDTAMLCDIGTGGTTGNPDTTIIENLAVSQNSNNQILIPIRIPGSTRITYRVRSSVASRAVNMRCCLFFSPLGAKMLPTAVDVLGTSTTTSAGTALSGSTNTWVEFLSATTKDYQAVVIVPSATTASATETNGRIDLGVGSPEIQVASVQFGGTAGGAVAFPSNTNGVAYGVYGGFIPTGTRLAVRHNLTNPDRHDFCVVGVPYV